MDPERFGKYRIVRKLAGGGMGRVYLARVGDTPQHVALKLIDLAPDQDSQDVLAAERRGAELQKRLSCVDTRVVRILDAGEREGYFFIAMEYVEGQDLAELMAVGPMAPQSAVAIATELCGVLASAHIFRAALEDRMYSGIVHGDIKPRNIRITPDGKLKLLDFGIAKAISMTRKVTQNHFGSIPYSSPERLRNGEVDASSDLWSVSVMLYEMLVGERYFQADSALRLEHLIRNYRAVLPGVERLPDGLRQVLTKALSANPDRRYQTADALRSDLESIQIGRPLPASVMVHAAEEEATRRTQRDASDRLEALEADDDGSTRRTVTALEAEEPPESLPPRRPAPPPPPPPWRNQPRPASPTGAFFRLGALALAAIFVLWSVIAFGRTVHVWNEAQTLEHDLASDKLTDLNAAWKKYDDLVSRASFPSLTLAGVRGVLKEKLLSSAEQALAKYRDSDAPAVYLPEWQKSRDELAHALEISPGDKKVRGKMWVCDGHILRIAGSGKNGGAKLTEAKTKFEDAAKLISDSPDPYLGLARLYAYGLHDADRAEQAMRDAERRNYHLGRRENVLLGDACRERADHWIREANQVKGLAPEVEYLRHADDDYGRAIDLYQKVVPFGNASTVLRRIMNDRDKLEQRLKAAQEPKHPEMVFQVPKELE